MIERSDATNPKFGIRNLKFPSEVCSTHKAPVGVPSHMGYKLADGVQVREEKFGLLFYNYRGPRLYFLPTKDLIASDFFDGHKSANELIESICSQNMWPRVRVRDRIKQVLIMLEKKGLIRGQSIC
jgi:putative mycofactocin binding protein MftB